MSKSKNVLQYDPAVYGLGIQEAVFTPAEARAEYNRLRKVAAQRLRRLEASPYGGSKLAKAYGESFGALPKGATESQIRKALSSTAHFLGQKASTITGAKGIQSKFIKTMHERGYNFINKDNAREFGEFMDAWKRSGAAQQYDSEQVVKLYRDAKAKKIDVDKIKDAFEKYLEAAKIEEVPDPEEAGAEEPSEDTLSKIEPEREKKQERKKDRKKRRQERRQQEQEQPQQPQRRQSRRERIKEAKRQAREKKGKKGRK